MADTISAASARRISLAAQGFGTRHPDAVGTRQLNLLIQRRLARRERRRTDVEVTAARPLSVHAG